jgi:hypothetical protein
MRYDDSMRSGSGPYASCFGFTSLIIFATFVSLVSFKDFMGVLKPIIIILIVTLNLI